MNSRVRIGKKIEKKFEIDSQSYENIMKETYKKLITGHVFVL